MNGRASSDAAEGNSRRERGAEVGGSGGIVRAWPSGVVSSCRLFDGLRACSSGGSGRGGDRAAGPCGTAAELAARGVGVANGVAADRPAPKPAGRVQLVL